MKLPDRQIASSPGQAVTGPQVGEDEPHGLEAFRHALSGPDAPQTPDADEAAGAEGAMCGIALMSPDCRFLSADDSLQRMLGFTSEDFNHLALADVVHPDDLPRLAPLRDQFARGEIDRFSMELQLLPKGRAALWVAAQVSLEHNQDGTVRHCVINISEIPGYAQTIAALRDSERRHKTLLSNLAGMAYRLRPDQNYQLEYISEGSLELLGLAPEKLLSGEVTQADLVHPDDFERMRATVDEALTRHTKARVVLRIRQPDGTYRWALETCRGIYSDDGRIEALEGFITDIHDQKQTEERLARSEKALRDAQELAGLGSWELDHVSGRVDWSEQTYAIFGRDPETFQPSLRTFQKELVHPDDRASERALLHSAISNRTPYHSIHRILRPDGEVRYITERGETTFSDQGEPLRTVGTTLDITDLKRTEEAMLQEQAFKNALLESSDFAVVACDANGFLRLFNRTARDWHGKDTTTLPPSEWAAHYGLYGHDGKTLLSPSQLPLVRAFNGEWVRDAELTLVHPGKPARFLLATGGPLFDSLGNKLGAMVILRDVTRQRMIEANLRHRDAILSAVAFAAERLLTTWDWEQEIDNILSTLGQAMQAGRAYVMRNRQTRDQRMRTVMHAEWCAPGIEPSYIWGLPRGFDMNAEGLEHWAERLRLGGVMQARSADFLPAEQAMMAADNVRGIVAIPIFVHGEWWGTLGFNDCETDRQWSLAEQEALRAAANTLASAIERRRQQEDRLARTVAEEANQAKSAFLATMSHEIRTPMNAILGLAEVLTRSSLNEEQSDLLATMRDAGGHLLHLIDDILDISKIEAGQLELQNSEIGLRETVEGVVGSLVGTAQDRGVALHAFVSPDLPARIVSDDLRLRQVIYNLLGNAIKFSADLPDRRGRVELRVDADEDSPTTLRITVRDNGIGMSEDVLARIFEPFQQGDSQFTRRHGGTGLGLAITHRILALMDGNVSVFSAPDEGSTFTAYIPMQTRGGIITASSPATPPLAGLRCIVMESNSYIAQDLQTYLRSAGAQIFAAGSVLQSSEAFPALIVCGPEQLASLSEPPALAHLLVEHGQHQKRRPHSISNRVTRIDGTGLSYGAVVQAAAVAVGRTKAPPPSRQSAAAPENRPDSTTPSPSQRPILVAEDDPLNQKVILRQLSLLGLNAQLVPNGADALVLARTGQYSLLLTDLHMPDMDGYELSRQIRAEQERARSSGAPVPDLPIIALTADARQPVANAVREAGIDNLLIKPVTLETLGAMLRPYFETPSATEPPAVSASAGVESEALLDQAALTARIGDDTVIQHEFLSAFLAHLEPLALELTTATDNADLAMAGSLAHRLKSSARAIGAMRLGAVCATLERNCRDNNKSALYEGVAQFNQVRAATVRAIALTLGEERHDSP